MRMTIEHPEHIAGRVRVSGAKNAATRIMAAALICDGESLLSNFPTELMDARYKMTMLGHYGATVVADSQRGTLSVSPQGIDQWELADYAVPIRTTYLVAAGILKRLGKVRIPYPGGCNLGSRGYDLHVKVWENMGCRVEELENCIQITVEKLRPLDISFPISTIGGTENALICAAMQPGESHIRNAYVSPEVADLIGFLRATGATIDVVGNSYIRVRGQEHPRGAAYTVMPDRIEALTWIVLAAISQAEMLIESIPFEAMAVPMIHLREAGVDIFRNDRSAYVCPDCLVNRTIQPFELACGTHPGIISDMQPFYVLLALRADGISRIYDYRYPERMKYLEELSKFCPGALEWERGKITVRGPAEFQPATAGSTDLRGSMAVVMAGILAAGQSEVLDVEMALRGYNNLPRKLAQLGIACRTVE